MNVKMNHILRHFLQFSFCFQVFQFWAKACEEQGDHIHVVCFVLFFSMTQPSSYFIQAAHYTFF